MAKVAAKPKVWALFQVANEYDQPENDLVTFWQTKPGIDQLARFMGAPLEKSTSEQILAIAELWKGSRVRFPNADDAEYRLELFEGSA